MQSKNSSYFLLALILIIFSAAGLWYLFRSRSVTPGNEDLTAEPTPEVTYSPNTSADPTSIGDNDLLPSSSPLISQAPTPTPEFQNFTSSYDKFSVVYSSDRKFYEDKEGSGNRYTFYRKSGNITVHVGPRWTWVHPGRAFNSDFLVSGQPTFRYDIAQQTIVDIQYNDLNYTIQCVHGANETNKAECEEFLKNFKFLTK